MGFQEGGWDAWTGLMCLRVWGGLLFHENAVMNLRVL